MGKDAIFSSALKENMLIVRVTFVVRQQTHFQSIQFQSNLMYRNFKEIGTHVYQFENGKFENRLYVKYSVLGLRFLRKETH